MFVSEVDKVVRNSSTFWTRRDHQLALFSISAIAKVVLEVITQNTNEVDLYKIITNDRFINDLLYLLRFRRYTLVADVNYCKSFIAYINMRFDFYRNEILRSKISTEC
jgi:hypothetical protein